MHIQDALHIQLTHTQTHAVAHTDRHTLLHTHTDTRCCTRKMHYTYNSKLGHALLDALCTMHYSLFAILHDVMRLIVCHTRHSNRLCHHAFKSCVTQRIQNGRAVRWACGTMGVRYRGVRYVRRAVGAHSVTFVLIPNLAPHSPNTE